MTEQDHARSNLVTVTRHGDDGYVAELALDRPEAMNAVSTEMAQAITAACREIDDGAQRSEVRAVVVTSTHPTAFCVGADLKERHRLTDAELVAQRPIARAGYAAVLGLSVPVVAAIDGYALGGGFEIALSCDILVAGEESTLGLPEVSVGVIPGGGGTQLLTRRVGWGRAASIVFTARRLTAAEAGELGAVDEVVPAGTARARGLELATLVARHSPVGVRSAKRAMRLGADVDLASGLEIEDAGWRATAFSGDRAEGVAAFNEKRAPRWPGV